MKRRRGVKLTSPPQRKKTTLKNPSYIRIKKKKMKLLTIEHQGSYENGRICCTSNEEFENKYLQEKKYRKVRDHCHDKKCD